VVILVSTLYYRNDNIHFKLLYLVRVQKELHMVLGAHLLTPVGQRQ